MTSIKSPIYEELNVDRLLVFLETGPQTNKYQQILLNAEEFNRVSQSIGKVTHKVGTMEHIELHLSEQVYELPDLIEHKEHEQKTI